MIQVQDQICTLPLRLRNKQCQSKRLLDLFTTSVDAIFPVHTNTHNHGNDIPKNTDKPISKFKFDFEVDKNKHGYVNDKAILGYKITCSSITFFWSLTSTPEHLAW